MMKSTATCDVAPHLPAVPIWSPKMGATPHLAVHRSGDPFVPGLVVDAPDPVRRRVAWESLGTGPGDSFEGPLETEPTR